MNDQQQQLMQQNQRYQEQQQTPVAEDDVILASGSYDHTIKFWTPHNGKSSRTITHQNSQVNDLKITPDRKYLAAAGFQHIRLYDLVSMQNNPDINLEGFSKNAASIGFFQRESRFLYSGGEDCITRVWDLRSKNHQSQKMHLSSSAVNSVRLGTNQVELYIGQQSGHISVWDIRTNSTMTTQIDQHDRIDSNVSVQGISLSADGKLLAAVDNIGYCHIYLVRGSTTLDACNTSNFLNSSSQLSTSLSDTVETASSPSSASSPISPLSTGSTSSFQTFKRLKKWKAHMSYVLKCLFSDNNVYLVTTSADNKAKVWKVQDLLKDNNHMNSANLTTTAPSTSTATTAPTETIETTATDAPTIAARTPTNLATTPVDLTPTSTLTSTTNSHSNHTTNNNIIDSNIINISAEKEQPLTPFVELTAENQRWVWDAAFSADSQFLFTASSDNLVRLWDVKTGEVRRVYVGHQKPVTALAFSDC